MSGGTTAATTATDGDLRVSQLSTASGRPRWSIAVFAHNEAGNIRAALRSVVAAAADYPVAVYVLANGCTDATVDEVRACAGFLPNLWLVEIALGDKANAWNSFVHRLLRDEQVDGLEACFFMDGDVTLGAGALPLLASSLHAAPEADAAGGMPASGRDRDPWRRRMVMNGMLAGNLYALRGRFVRGLREARIRIPVGLIGEDFLVSWLVANIAWGGRETAPVPRTVFNPCAEFSFRSLSPWHPVDYRTYLRRRWRYTLRGIQFHMLITLLVEEGLAAMPADTGELYARAAVPSGVRWLGPLQTVLQLLAVRKIRATQGSVAFVSQSPAQ